MNYNRDLANQASSLLKKVHYICQSICEREHVKRLPHPRMAAGVQITNSRHGEVVTKITIRDSCEAP